MWTQTGRRQTGGSRGLSEQRPDGAVRGITRSELTIRTVVRDRYELRYLNVVEVAPGFERPQSNAFPLDARMVGRNDSGQHLLARNPEFHMVAEATRGQVKRRLVRYTPGIVIQYFRGAEPVAVVAVQDRRFWRCDADLECMIGGGVAFVGMSPISVATKQCSPRVSGNWGPCIRPSMPNFR